MTLQPSRRDTIGPPPRNVSDLAALVRHHGSALGSVEPGLLGGRWRTPRLVPDVPSQIVGGDSGGSDNDGPEWEWGDRKAVTTPGQQSFVLSNVAIEESLTIRWHPRGITHGGVPWTNELFVLEEDGQTVTIYDTDGIIEAGDVFSAQYQFDPGLSNAADEFAGLTYIGATAYYGPSGHPTSLALPAGTQVGDTIVLGCAGNLYSVTDDRLTNVGSGAWIGQVTDLSNVLATSGNSYWAACLSVFRLSGVYSDAQGATGTTTPAALPQVGGDGAIAVVNSGFSVVDGFAAVPTSYSDGGGSGSGKCSVRVAYWVDLSATSSPASTVDIVGVSNWEITTIGFGGA